MRATLSDSLQTVVYDNLLFLEASHNSPPLEGHIHANQLLITIITTDYLFLLSAAVLLALGILLYAFSALKIVLSGDIHLNPGPTLFSTNIWSLKVDNLLANMPNNVDILCITETKLDNSIEYFILGSGGLCLQSGNNVCGTRLLQPDLEMMWVKVSFDKTHIVLGIGYRNPALPVIY
jgi:hypothetical protein